MMQPLLKSESWCKEIKGSFSGLKDNVGKSRESLNQMPDNSDNTVFHSNIQGSLECTYHVKAFF